MVKQDQKYPLRRLFLNENGQAVVEYILLIVVVISLVFGVKKAFSHVDDFISHYIGDYVTCLMEYGELPSLGVAAADQKRHLDGSGKKCDEDFAGFTFVDGRPSNGGGTGSGGPGTGGTGGTGSGNSNNNSANAGSKNNSSNAGKGGSNDKSGSDGDSGSGNDLGRGRSGSRSGKQQSPYANGQINRSNSLTTNDSYDDGGRKVRVLEEDEEAKKKKKNSGLGGFRSRSGGNYGNDRYRAITGIMQAEMEKTLPRKPRAPASTVVRLKDDSNRLGPYSKVFTPPPVKAAPVKEDDNTGFSFGFFIRWLLIAAMILAIIVFFGGQIMNYSNSKE